MSHDSENTPISTPPTTPGVMTRMTRHTTTTTTTMKDPSRPRWKEPSSSASASASASASSASASAASASAATDDDTRARKVVVFGSVNVDHCFRGPRLPRIGETVGGCAYERRCGGKGANQACAAAETHKWLMKDARVASSGERRGAAAVAFVGAYGAKDRRSKRALAAHGVDVSEMGSIDGCETGCAAVLVNSEGENCIAVAPGANAHAGRMTIPRCDVLVLQCEVPQEANYAAVTMAKTLNPDVCVVLNCAPVLYYDPQLMKEVDVLIVNESERERLEMFATTTQPKFDPGMTITTFGEKGASLKGCMNSFPGVNLDSFGVYVPAVKPKDDEDEGDEMDKNEIDTVGAGDAFVGAFAAALSEHHSVISCLAIASAVASRMCEYRGARLDRDCLLNSGKGGADRMRLAIEHIMKDADQCDTKERDRTILSQTERVSPEVFHGFCNAPVSTIVANRRAVPRTVF